MLSRMKAKLDGGRALLYETARYVDVYKALEEISKNRQLTPEERKEMKKYSRMADAITPLCKGMNSEYANQAAYDAISIHGGSGFIMEYEAQRLYRDARIFSIYEGTTQLQVVAAIRYVTNGTYLKIIDEMLEHEVAEELTPLQEYVREMTVLYKQSIEYVKNADNQEMHDFLAHRLCDMTGDILVSLLLLDDATRDKDLFGRSAKIFVLAAKEKVVGHADYIQNFTAGDLKDFQVENAQEETEK